MCEVQPEWNVREDHSERAGTLFVLIASREGKQQPLLPRCFLSIFYVFLSWLLSRMNITLFYPSSWIICSIWGEGRGGEGGRQAGRRQSGEHRFRPCWKSIMWLPFTTCLTPESWTQPFIPQRMTQCECDRVNTAVKKKKKKLMFMTERKSGYMERKRGPCLSAVNYTDACLSGSTERSCFCNNFPLFKGNTLLWLCSCSKGKPWCMLFTGGAVIKQPPSGTMDNLHNNSYLSRKVEVPNWLPRPPDLP